MWDSEKDEFVKLPTLEDLFNFGALEIEWDLEKLIPAKSIVIFQGKARSEKTFLALQIGSAIADGREIFNLTTCRKTTYYIDFENPLTEICRRAQILGPSSMKVWHLGHDPKPPRLDSEDWETYKLLSPGVLIFDSLRSAHFLDENNSRDMTLILSRLKELRQLEFTIIAIIHTQKIDEKKFRGSGAIVDQADHILGLYRADCEDREPFDTDSVFRFGTIEKTRFEPFEIFLKFNPKRGFERTTSPEFETMRAIHEFLIDYCRTNEAPVQSKLVSGLKENLSLPERQIRKFLSQGEGVFWTSRKVKNVKNARVYSPILTK
jgi:archaellum biogenesis ATPase FlaH